MSNSVKSFTYKNPPITEAIIDFQFNLDGITIEKIEDFYEKFKKYYPSNEKIISNRGTFSIGLKDGDVNHSVQTEDVGFKYVNDDKKYVLVITKGNFSLTRLAPYENWDKFSSEAKRIFAAVIDEFEFPDITRVGIRYINKIDIPLPIDDFDEYLKNPPVIPSELPQGISNFLMTYQIPMTDINGLAQLTQTMLSQGENASILSIILDIDISSHNNLPTNTSDLWLLVDKIRTKKNLIFKSHITKKAEELFS